MGWAAVALAVLWSLAGFFVLDWALEMTHAQRAVAWLVVLGLIAVAYWRLARPWFARQESELDVALLTERRHGIDSDLVAALQFERPEAAGWGSPELAQAVIHRAARRTPHLEFTDAEPPPGLRRRTVLLGATLLLLGIAGLTAPRHLSTFLSRLLFSHRHYPTDTRIEQVLVDGRVVIDPGGQAGTARVSHGHPVVLEVIGGGKLPSVGRAELVSLETGSQSELELSAESGAPERFFGRLDALAESVRCKIFLGDAWSEPLEILAVDPPRLELQWRVQLPGYMGSGDRTRSPAKGLRQISVVEGSRLGLTVTSNEPLRAMSLRLREDDYPLRPAGGREPEPSNTTLSEKWEFTPRGTPLEAVVDTLPYEVRGIDAQGAALPHPPTGTIRVTPDRPPRVALSAVTHHVLPTARPTIRYEVEDDHGVGELLLIQEIESPGGETDVVRTPVATAGSDRPPATLRDSVRLDLAPLELTKGDRLRVSMQAADFRGPRPGESARSEPLVFHVTDKQGILTIMAESDEQAVEALQTMIRRQMDLGEDTP
jgi:hypothetical protein